MHVPMHQQNQKQVQLEPIKKIYKYRKLQKTIKTNINLLAPAIGKKHGMYEGQAKLLLK